jgi:hypothetical protein
MVKKAQIPDGLRQRVLDEAGFHCAYCGHRDGLNLTCHHIQAESEGGPTVFNNLIALCFNCHHRVDQTGTIPKKDIRRLKRHLVHRRITQAGVNALKLADSNPVGVMAFPFAVQHLVEDGLLSHEGTQVSHTETEGETEVTALYQITDAGRRLVEAWLK